MQFKFAVTVKQEISLLNSTERKTEHNVETDSETTGAARAISEALARVQTIDGRITSVFLFNHTEQPAAVKPPTPQPQEIAK